jgi:hypothetical protein
VLGEISGNFKNCIGLGATSDNNGLGAKRAKKENGEGK